LQYLFLTFIALAVAVFAPLRVTLSLLATIGIIAIVVKVAATKIMGPVSITDSLRSVAWAFSLLIAALLGLLGASQGHLQADGILAVAVLGGLFAAFILGFKIALGATFRDSAAIAAVSTVTSAMILLVLKPVLF
jgi:hypothetical protein